MSKNINDTQSPDQDNTNELLEEIAEVLGMPQSALEEDREPTAPAPEQEDDSEEGSDPVTKTSGCC